jgi:hypothetical protein
MCVQHTYMKQNEELLKPRAISAAAVHALPTAQPTAPYQLRTAKTRLK